MASYRIEGNIISSEILDKVAQGEAGKQSPKDFWFEPGASLREEIARAWADAKAQYQVFKSRRERLGDGESGISETRRFWMLPFFEFLGYHLESSTAETVEGSSYAISHRAENLDGFPVNIMGCNQSLDEKPKQGLRMSPHAILQEYLNLTEHLFGIATNGVHLRLLRDASRLTRLSFLEFDLVQMMEEDLYSDFALLYRTLHASRMPKTKDGGDTSIIESYHQDALDAGSRIRERLSKAVEHVIVRMANGFLQHPANQPLRDWAAREPNAGEELYGWMLKVIYRLLFLMVTEERDLIYPKPANAGDAGRLRRLRQIYYDYYSVGRLRRLSEKRQFADKRHTDGWKALRMTFRLFEAGKTGEPLGLSPLGGDLFGSNALGMLGSAELDNETLLTCLHRLNFFENERGQQVRVNYGSLDVEEFGSVYEGLLEYKAVVEADRFTFQQGTGRSSSGSHYTPDELVHPLIKHSLDHLIEDCLKGKRQNQPPSTPSTLSTSNKPSSTLINQEQALLSLNVCDVACGSGHILLAAARRIGLALARVRTGEDQPNPAALRQAVRDAITHCIYGVDKNPLAVELCKVALWLEAHNPGQPLNFLDHKIKCGDAIVGLAQRDELELGIPDEAFKKLPGDDSAVVRLLAKKNKDERKKQEKKKQLQYDFEKTMGSYVAEAKAEYQSFLHLPETTPEEIAAKEKAYRRFVDGKGYTWQKTLADSQVAQFFIAKTKENQHLLVTDADYRQMLAGYKGWQGVQTSKATAEGFERRFFHWFLEFPEVFQRGGLDCVLGNPPFLGGQRLSGNFGNDYLEYLRFAYAPAGAVDLVTYFFRRIFSVLKNGGFQSLISTNTIAQGDARTGGLEVIASQNGVINHAVRSMRWPGLAAVEVALVTIHKGDWKSIKILDGKPVKFLSTYLDDSEYLGEPYKLKQNENKSFQGSIVLGQGFVMEPEEAQKLIAQNPNNEDVLFPYLNGSDLNSNPDQSPSRWVINFFDWPLRRYSESEWKGLDKKLRETIRRHFRDGKFEPVAPPDYQLPVADDYTEILQILEERVKPERLASNDKMARERWWLFLRSRPEMQEAVETLERVLVHTRVTKTHSFNFASKGQVFSEATVVFAFQNAFEFSIVESSIHEYWAWQYSSTMKGDRRYSPSDCFQTFPFPKDLSKTQEHQLETIGETYHEHRRQLMLSVQLGLTKTYNQFHNPQLAPIHEPLDAKAVEKRYGKETANLWKHLEKTDNTIPYNEALERIRHLRHLHVQMDEAVLEAYGWHTASDDGPAIQLRHDFYEVDYLPQNDRVRFTIHPEARKEVLKRLLLLNHAIYEEEVEKGLHEKGNKKATRKQSSDDEEDMDDNDDKGTLYPGEQGELFERGGRQGRLF